MKNLTKHIGIVACSYEGASMCFQNICRISRNVLGEHHHPEISMHLPPFQDYMKSINEDNWDEVANLMNKSALKLQAMGAEILICPDNTIHRVFEQSTNNITIPWLNIAEEVAKIAKIQNFKKVAILGTKYLMESQVYPQFLEKHEIEFQIPEEKDRQTINQYIFNELVNGVFSHAATNEFISIIQKMKVLDCDAVILGCTEIPFIINPSNSPLPVLDSNLILSEAALKKAIG